MRPEITAVAQQLGASVEGAYRIGRDRLIGMRVPCFLDTEVKCDVVLTDEYAHHLTEDGELAYRQSVDHFCWLAKRHLQPWRSFDQVCVDAAEEMRKPWVWQDLIKPGTVTLLATSPKLGKTTLLFDFLSAMAEGRGLFLDLPISKANVLYVTEEGDVPLAFKGELVRYGPLRRAGYVQILTADQVEGWEALMKSIEKFCQDFPDVSGGLPHPFPTVVVIDTLSFFFTDVEDENSAGQVRNALRLLVNRVRKYGFGCVLVHHTTKGRGLNDERWMDAVRGSTAFAGNVDTIAFLAGSHNANFRRLFLAGRLYTEPPDPIPLDFSVSGGYRRMTSEEEEEQQEIKMRALRDALEENPKASLQALADVTGIPKTTVHRLRPRIVLEREDG